MVSNARTAAQASAPWSPAPGTLWISPLTPRPSTLSSLKTRDQLSKL